MLALSIGGVGKPHRRRRCRSRIAVVPYIDPESACLRLAHARCKHWYGRVVCMHFARRQHIPSQRLHQRAQQRTACADPARHGGAVQIHAGTGMDGRLPIQRLMVREFRYEDMGQQPRCSDATFDWPAGRRRLDDHVAAGTRLLMPDMADHLECRIDQVELLGDFFAQRLEIATAGRACPLHWFQHPLLAWQMGR